MMILDFEIKSKVAKKAITFVGGLIPVCIGSSMYYSINDQDMGIQGPVFFYTMLYLIYHMLFSVAKQEEDKRIEKAKQQSRMERYGA